MDRLLRGFIAGVGGAIIMNAVDLFIYYGLGIYEIRFLDWAGVILYGHIPHSHSEAIYSLIIQIVWSGFLGVLFAFLIKEVTARHYLFKGALFAIITGFILYAFPVMLKVKPLSQASLATVISNHAGGLLWGLSTAWILRKLDRYNLSNKF